MKLKLSMPIEARRRKKILPMILSSIFFKMVALEKKFSLSLKLKSRGRPLKLLSYSQPLNHYLSGAQLFYFFLYFYGIKIAPIHCEQGCK